MPFDPDAYLAEHEKKDFDPDAYLAANDKGFVDSTPQSDTVDSAIRGGLDALTLGHMDEIAGAGRHPVGAFKAITGNGSEDPDVQAYQAERDKYRQLYARAKEEHPVAFTGGGVAGAVAGPGKLMAGLKGAGAVVAATGLGAVTGAGMSDAEIADHEYGRLALHSAVGGVVGGVTQGAANKFGGYLEQRAASKAVEPAVETVVEQSTAAGAPAKVGTRATRWAKEIFGKAKPVENADEVAAAVKDLSGQENVPGYLLTKDKQVQNLADTLLKSPTIGGAMTRKEVMPVYEGLERFGKAVADRAGSLSAYETGTAVKRGAAARFQSMIAPAEAIYEELEGNFATVPLERLAFRRGVGKLRDKFKTDITGSSQKMLDQLTDTFSRVENVADLRQFRTNLGKYLDGNVSQAQREIVGTMYGVLTRERDRSILRSAVSTGPKIARAGKNFSMLQDLKKADRIYRDGVQEASSALGIEGTSKQATSSAIRDYLQTTPGEQVVKDLFDKGDFAAISRVARTFPEQFKLLKERAVSDLVERSKENGMLSTQRLVTNLNKYNPEIQQMLMEDLLPQAKSAQTVLGALPRNFNPSDTSTRLEYLDLLSPKKNVQSMVQRQLLKRGAPKASTLKMGDGPPQMTRIISKVAATQGMEKFLKPLQDASQRGGQSFAATYFIMSQTSPEFRKLLGNIDERPEQ